MNLLGESLAERVQQLTTFSLNTTLLIGIQMINILQVLHENDLLHRDLKSSNFLFGLNTNKLFLIDFGLSKRFCYTGAHIPLKRNTKLIGSANFVSINVHLHIEPSRRDDIESCLYIILFMLLGKLDWFFVADIQKIIELKQELTNDESTVPIWFKNLLVYVRQLEFQEMPNYEHLIQVMQTELKYITG
jgi:hypothetical protein